MTDGAAHALVAAGVARDDPVGVALTDRAEHLVMLLALGRVGATVIPLDPRWPAAEAQGVAHKFGARHLLCDADDPRDGWIGVDAAWFATDLPPYHDALVTLDTPFVLSLSSGTTGLPKGPRVSHGKFVARFDVYWLDLTLNGQDRFVTATPLYFGGGRGFALAMLYAGGTAVLFCPPYDPGALVDFVGRIGGTAMFLVPTLLRRLIAEPRTGLAFPDLRVLISSGSALYPAEARAVRETLTPNLYQYYSSTEGGGCSLLTPAAFADHPDSVGLPCAGVAVEVVGSDHRRLPAGEVGRLRYRSAASADAYFMNDDPAAFHEGWFYPGDMAVFDADGFLHLRGRDKDMIIRGGVNIYPSDIETVLTALSGVAEAAVAGVPSREMGEDIVAFVAAASHDAAPLREACAARLARYKVPSQFVFLDELPKAANGKVDKRALVGLVSGAARADPAAS